MARRRRVEWLGKAVASTATAVGTIGKTTIISAADLDNAEVGTIVKLLGCITVQVARIFSADPQTTQTVAYFLGIGVFNENLTANDTAPSEMDNPWMWTCSGRGVVGEEITGTAGINTHVYAGLVRWHEIVTAAMRKVPQDHELRLVHEAVQVVGTSTGIESTWNVRALCKRG